MRGGVDIPLTMVSPGEGTPGLTAAYNAAVMEEAGTTVLLFLLLAGKERNAEKPEALGRAGVERAEMGLPSTCSLAGAMMSVTTEGVDGTVSKVGMFEWAVLGLLRKIKVRV